MSDVSTNDSRKLRECPFCGGEAEVTPIAWNIIQCTQCTCQLIVLPLPEGATEEYAIEAWNTRYTEGVEIAPSMYENNGAEG